jgi:hypothetical protein
MRPRERSGRAESRHHDDIAPFVAFMSFVSFVPIARSFALASFFTLALGLAALALVATGLGSHDHFATLVGRYVTDGPEHGPCEPQ